MVAARLSDVAADGRSARVASGPETLPRERIRPVARPGHRIPNSGERHPETMPNAFWEKGEWGGSAALREVFGKQRMGTSSRMWDRDDEERR